MLELDGGVYPFVKTTKDNTDDIVDFINKYAQEHGITDAKGNAINIDKNKANVLYMMLFGVGYMTTILQRLIRSAADSNSIQNSSAKQLDLIAETMHTSRKAATYSIMDCEVNYTISLDVPSIQLDDSTYLSVQQTDGRVLVWVPVEATLLDGDTGQHSKNVQFRCTEAGPVYVPDAIISQFAVPVEGVDSITNSNCIKGSDEETTEQLRERLQKRAESNTRVDRCAMALSDLQGVAKAAVLFNPHIDETFNIIQDNIIQVQNYQASAGYGPFVVPPRKACVFISGTSELIPQTFFDHMICLTTNECNDETKQFVTQNYTTRSGQVIPFYHTTPINKQINVYIYTLNAVTQEVSDNIKDAVADYISKLNIGQSLSDGELIKYLYSLYPDIDLTGINFTYSDYFIVSDNAFDHSKLVDILDHLNSDPMYVPGYEDDNASGVFTGPVTLYGNMCINVLNDVDDYKNVPYVLQYDAESLGDKWTAEKFFTQYSDMYHNGVHSVTAYPYELIQTNLSDESTEHISVIQGRV